MRLFGGDFGSMGVMRRRGGGGPSVLAYSVLDPYSSLTVPSTRTATNATLAKVGAVFGSIGAIEVRGDGSSAGATVTTPSIGNTEVPSTAWAGALLAFAFDFGTVPMKNLISTQRLTITTNSTGYGMAADTGAGAALISYDSYQLGKRWVTVSPATMRLTNWAGIALSNLAVGAAKATAIQTQYVTSGVASTYAAAIPVGPLLLLPNPHKPMICITVDDHNVRTPELAQLIADINAAKGVTIRPTLYACYGLMSNPGSLRMNLAQTQNLRDSYGWEIAMDGDAFSDALSKSVGRTAMVASMIQHAADLTAANVLSPGGDKHFCYSFGVCGPHGGAVARTANATSGSTDTITLQGNGPWTGSAPIVPGAVVKGTGLGTDPTVIAAPTSTTVRLSAPVNFGVATALVFCCNESGVTTTCTGNTTVTCTTTNLVVGMTMFGEDVPDNTTITAVGGSTITVSNAVPATCQRANFALLNAEFQTNLVYQSILDAGFRTGRRAGSTPVCSQFGVDPFDRISMGGTSIDIISGTESVRVADQARIIAQFEDTILNGRDRVFYCHVTSNLVLDGVTGNLRVALEYLADQIAAGRCTSPGIIAMDAAWQARGFA